MTYSEIKAILAAMAPQAFKGFINTTTGTIPELALYARITNNEIAGNPHKFSWMLREYSLTLTGATTYNLASLIPDLERIYQVYGDTAPGREVPYQGLREYNRDFSGGVRMTLLGKSLRITGASSGTLTIPYYSNYLVLDNDLSTRKLNFVDDDDVSIITETHAMMLIEGIMRFVARKKNEKPYTKPVMLYDGRVAQIEPFTYLLQQAVLADKDIQSSIFDFRFVGA
jgi:hypothetical protein